MKRLAISLALAALACGPNIAQDPHPRPRDISQTQSVPLEPQDRDFIERAAEGGTAELTIGGLVDGRAMRPEIISFGHMMVTDHTAANAKLNAIAQQKKIALPSSLGEHQAGYDRVEARRLDQFDREFIKLMVEDHQQAAELFRGEAMNGVDADLKAFAAATLPTIEAHLAHATALAKAIDANPQDLAAPPAPAATQIPPASTVKTATFQ